MDKALTLTSDNGIFIYSGLKLSDISFFDKADKASPENLEIWKGQIKIYTLKCS